ncbi:MAG: DUF58 domain-containing protein [Cyclobacteriaceae bacterium]
MADRLFQIDPEVLSSIHELDWAIRSLALGEYHGIKQSRRLGTGMEFSQYRPYSQGDDLRQLDWKMYARTDKFYIKQSEIETNIDVTFMIDTSKSMCYTEGGWSKLDASKMLCGVLAHVALQNGDWISLADGVSMRSGNDQRHWNRFLIGLQGLAETVKFEAPYIEQRKSKELFVFMTDMYDSEEDLMDFVKSLKSPRNEVIVFHMMGEKEETLDFGNAVKLKDLETGLETQMNPQLLKEDYQKQVKNWKEELSHDLLSVGIDYHAIDFTVPMAELINAFIHRRKRLL